MSLNDDLPVLEGSSHLIIKQRGILKQYFFLGVTWCLGLLVDSVNRATSTSNSFAEQASLHHRPPSGPIWTMSARNRAAERKVAKMCGGSIFPCPQPTGHLQSPPAPYLDKLHPCRRSKVGSHVHAVPAGQHEQPPMPPLHVQLSIRQQPVHLASSTIWACGVVCADSTQYNMPNSLPCCVQWICMSSSDRVTALQCCRGHVPPPASLPLLHPLLLGWILG